MASKNTVISEIEIDPNSLGYYTELPLPEFAIQALRDNGFTYNEKSGNTSDSKQSAKQDTKLVKLSSHLRSVSKHINHDGPIVRPDRAGGF
jgi:hypothetical protein